MAIALVTGTSSGLGLATAVSLARAGHTVTATMRNLDGGADLRQIIAKEKLPITLTALDVDDDDSVHDAFAKVVAEHGWIDILVNNAGIPGAAGGVEEIPFNVFQQVMETNFFGALRCIKAVVPSMRERRKGTIVNITSLAGRIARASLAPYAASKWALEALSECLGPGNACVRRSRGDRRTRRHCHADSDKKGIRFQRVVPIPMPGGSRPSSPQGSPIRPRRRLSAT
jgi:NAD(P)-dependent dehydrogenase (short-subunit alcohol dehydrogenase family)